MAAATTFVDHDDEIQVTAKIESLEQLFAAPDFDPFSEQPRTSAVVDEIIAHLRTSHLSRPPVVSVTLLLPSQPRRCSALLASESPSCSKRSKSRASRGARDCRGAWSSPC